MRSGGNNFNYFPNNKLTKLTNFVQFIRMLMFRLKDWGSGLPGSPLATPLLWTNTKWTWTKWLSSAVEVRAASFN